jgi:hypothetical protein
MVVRGAGGQRWRCRSPGGGPLGMAAVPAGLAPAAPGAGAAHRRRGRGDLQRLGRLQPGSVGRRPVRHGQPSSRPRRVRTAPAGRWHLGGHGVVRHRRGDRPPAGAGSGLGRDRGAAGPGPARRLRRADAAAAGGPLPGRRRRGRGHRCGGRDLAGRPGRHAGHRPVCTDRGRPGREPRRPGRRVRPGVRVAPRLAGVGDGPGAGQPRAGDDAAGRIRWPARVAPRLPCGPAVPDARAVREGDRRRGCAGLGHGGPAAGRPDRRGRLRRRRAAPPAPARHVGRDRRGPEASSPGAAGQRRHRRCHRRRGRDRHRPAGLDRAGTAVRGGDPSPDRPVRPAMVADRGGHAACGGDGDRGGVVASPGSRADPGHPCPVGSATSTQTGAPHGRRRRPPRRHRRGLPGCGHRPETRPGQPVAGHHRHRGGGPRDPTRQPAGDPGSRRRRRRALADRGTVGPARPGPLPGPVRSGPGRDQPRARHRDGRRHRRGRRRAHRRRRQPVRTASCCFGSATRNRSSPNGPLPSSRASDPRSTGSPPRSTTPRWSPSTWP